MRWETLRANTETRVAVAKIIKLKKLDDERNIRVFQQTIENVENPQG